MLMQVPNSIIVPSFMHILRFILILKPTPEKPE